MTHRSLPEALAQLRTKDLLGVTSDLVKIPSMSGQETAIMDYVVSFLRDKGIEPVVLGRRADRPNVVATIGTGAPPVVVLNGHLDTVFPASRAQWQSDPFDPVVNNGTMAGLGSLDMKGACAAMLLAFVALHRHADNLTGTVQLQLVCDEEDNGYYGTPYLVELMKQGSLPRPDHVIVGEYTGLEVMTAERGSFKFHIHFRGRATHTATARVEGRNAIHAAAEAVRLLDRDLAIEHPAVGKAVMSVNKIEGGRFFSQVADACTILVDRRLVPGETMESALDHARDIVESLRPAIPWLEFEATPALDDVGGPRFVAPNLTPRDAPVAEAIRKAHERVTGKTPRDFIGWFGATDGRCFRYEGIDCAVYGPTGAHAHGPNEFVELESLATTLLVTGMAAAELSGMSDKVGAPVRTEGGTLR